MTIPAPAPTPVRRLYRDPTDRVVAGVAAGIAGHLGAPPILVRVAFVALAGYNGSGAILYAVFWAVLPMAPSMPIRHRKVGQLLSFLAIGLGLAVVLGLTGAGGARSATGWLIAVVAFGAGVIWHVADPRRRERWTISTTAQFPWLASVMESDRRGYLLRFIGGGSLIVLGAIGAVAVSVQFTGASLSAIVYGLMFSLIALAGVGLALAPVLWRMFGQLRAEREARIRETERAELAAMVHDQVLHTLALIQRNSADVKTVLRLARGQERTLRNWLYKSAASPTERLAAALELVSAEVEDTYAVAVETVVVGDLEVDEPVAALVAAAREALVNAARHSKVQTVSLYAEVEPELISVFVRDRGVGFDLSAVEEDRHGVRGSIIGRMRRHGGKAEIRSEPGDGTEVRLTMPISALNRRATEGKR
jgi:signal transduction histidine kinase/phage shock protein PspC (stress-responsive transcriptional regulator)